MKEPFEAYIKVIVLPETAGGAEDVNVLLPDATSVRVPLEKIDMALDTHKAETSASAEKLAAMQKELDEVRAELTSALNTTSLWRQRSLELRDHLCYLTGVVDAAMSLTALELPNRDLDTIVWSQ